MSKLAYICYREGTRPRHNRAHMEQLAKRLCPDNIEPVPPRVIEGKGILLGIFNPVEGLPVDGESVCLGVLFEERSDWWRPGAEAPDGTYALVRADASIVEVLSDVVASRTLWYAHTDELFIASTSQRAIVFFLQSFAANPVVYPWMLSSGTLGPGYSWDQRIKCLPGNARLVLNRATWRLTLTHRPVTLEPEPLSVEEHERRLQDAIEDTFARLRLDLTKWVLPLSGGLDSRMIALMLKDRPGLKTITWGLKSALADKQSDAYVGTALAKHFKVRHEYYETDMSPEPIEIIFERFVLVSEGCVDHISAYMDGFSVWRRLHEEKVAGVIRGDAPWGQDVCASELAARSRAGLLLLDDYVDLAHQSGQSLPGDLMRQSDESLSIYRDRLRYEFRLPVVMAALNDLKSSYVEIANPLCARRIVERSRRMPDALRDGKKSVYAVARRIGPGMPYASRRAIAYSSAILGNPRVVEFLIQSLKTDNTADFFPDEFVNSVLAGVRARESANRRRQQSGLRRAVSRLLPDAVKKTIRGDTRKLRPDFNAFAFRMFVITKMHRVLTEDAAQARLTHEMGDYGRATPVY